MSGLVRLRFSASILHQALPMIPRSLELVGSEASGDRIITLLFASPEVPDGEVVDMMVEVRDTPTSRTINLKAV